MKYISTFSMQWIVIFIRGFLINSNHTILKLIKALLSNHCQIVKVNLMELVPAMVLSLILQDSVLGSIKFLHTYKWFFWSCEMQYLYFFTDNTKFLRQINTKEWPFHLQSDRTSLDKWSSQKGLLTFYPKNCHFLMLKKFYNITHIER